MMKLLTKIQTKRVTAAAIAEAKARNGWSNAEAGDAMDCSEGTVRQRLLDDETGNQMTVHELRRITQSDGPSVAAAILEDLGYRLVPIVGSATTSDAIALAAAQSQFNADLLAALPDGIDRAEARRLLPSLDILSHRISAFTAGLDFIIDGGPASK